MRGAITPLTHTPSWHGAELISKTSSPVLEIRTHSVQQWQLSGRDAKGRSNTKHKSYILGLLYLPKTDHVRQSVCDAVSATKPGVGFSRNPVCKSLTKISRTSVTFVTMGSLRATFYTGVYKHLHRHFSFFVTDTGEIRRGRSSHSRAEKLYVS